MRIFIPIIIASAILTSCVSANKWEQATITFNDGHQLDAKVFVSEMSYYNFFRALEDSTITIYNPESGVINLENDKFRYVSMFFDEARYGMDSYSFGKRLAGHNIMIIETMYQMKTCACKTSGGFFKGYFIVIDKEHIQIMFGKKHIIANINELNSFIEKYHDFEIPATISTIDELTSLINNAGI